jgi:hypothetical protein
VLDLQNSFQISKFSVDNFVDMSALQGAKPLKSRVESECPLKKHLERTHMNQQLTVAIPFVAPELLASLRCRTAA